MSPSPTPTSNKVKRGAAIFIGTDYPQTWSEFIGQEPAKDQLRTAIKSAELRQVRLDHTLFACGLHGIGKTTLAQILAFQAGAGIVTVSGALSVNEARTILLGMKDGDILFWDEFHLAVAGNRNKADWLLPFMTDGHLVTNKGTEDMPDVTLVAATTDAGKLPQTIISRFMLRPRLDGYNIAEATEICKKLTARMKVRLSSDPQVEHQTLLRIAIAANRNPREMRMILTAVRDLAAVGPVDLNKAFEWAGLTFDGLTRECQDILKILVVQVSYTASLDTVAAIMGEPGPLKHHEQTLLKKGLVTISGRGRVLTEAGITRAQELIAEENGA